MVKKILCLCLCLLMLFSCVACGQSKSPETNNTNNNNITDTENTKNEENKTPSTKGELIPFVDEDNAIVGFDGKIEQILETSDWFAFYSNNSIYHTDRDDDGNYFLHQFRLENVNEILFYHWSQMGSMKYVSNDICAYTKDGDDKNVYVSVTAPSENVKLSESITFSVECKPENFEFAIRDGKTIFAVINKNGVPTCIEYDGENDKIVGESKLVAETAENALVDIKHIQSNCFDAFAIDTNDVAHLLEDGGEIQEKDGQYYVEYNDKYGVVQDVKKVVSHAMDDVFEKTDDNKNLYSCIRTGDGIKTTKIVIPNNYTTDDITNAWGMNDYAVIEFKNSEYYIFNEINSFEKDDSVQMKKIIIPETELKVVDFGYNDDVLMLMSDGNLYKAKIEK